MIDLDHRSIPGCWVLAHASAWEAGFWRRQLSGDGSLLATAAAQGNDVSIDRPLDDDQNDLEVILKHNCDGYDIHGPRAAA